MHLFFKRIKESNTFKNLRWHFSTKELRQISSISLLLTLGKLYYCLLIVGRSVGQERKADFSAIIEHTNRVIYLEDDDVASVVDGGLSLHRVRSSSSANDTQVRNLFIITSIQVQFSVTSAKLSSSFSRLWKVLSTASCRKRSSSSQSPSWTRCEDACPLKR